MNNCLRLTPGTVSFSFCLYLILSTTDIDTHIMYTVTKECTGVLYVALLV